MHGQWKLEPGYRPLGQARGLIFCRMISYQGEVVANLYPDPFSVRILVAGKGINPENQSIELFLGNRNYHEYVRGQARTTVKELLARTKRNISNFICLYVNLCNPFNTDIDDLD